MSVSEIIADARSFAASSNTSAAALIDKAAGAINSISGTFVTGGPSMDALPSVTISTILPELETIVFEPGSAPELAGELVNLPSILLPSAPASTAVKPTFSEPSQPSDLRNFDLSPPSINTSFTFPSIPGALQNIDTTAPTITDRAVPVAPQLMMPVFGASAPTDDITPPTDYVEQFEAAYQAVAPSMRAALAGEINAWMAQINPQFATQMTRLEDKLATYIAGGTALTPAVENAIYERAKSKVNAEVRRARDTAAGDAAKRGFTMPDGQMATAMQSARQAGADANARASIDIGIKQAELEQQNIQFALTMSAQLRTTVMNASISYHGSLVQLNGQALEYAKAVLTAMVQVYDTLVKAYGLRLDAYKAEVAVYEARLRGVLALIQIYQAEISALETLTKLDIAKIDIYKARLEALNILGNVYKTQIEAVIGQANVEKIKVELFGAQVQAYDAEARSKSAQWQGYSAALGGQEAKFRAYGEEVRADGAKTDAYRVAIQAKQAELQSVVTYNQGILQQRASQIDLFKVSVDAKGKVAATQVELQSLKLRAFAAQVSAQEAAARITQEYFKTKATIGQEEFRSILTYAVQSAQVNNQKIEAAANIGIAGARVYQGLASAALAGQNTLAVQSE